MRIITLKDLEKRQNELLDYFISPATRFESEEAQNEKMRELTFVTSLLNSTRIEGAL